MLGTDEGHEEEQLGVPLVAYREYKLKGLASAFIRE